MLPLGASILGFQQKSPNLSRGLEGRDGTRSLSGAGIVGALWSIGTRAKWGPVAATGILLLRALSLQIAADTCSYISHSWLFLIKGGSSHRSLKLLLSPSIFSPQELGPVFAEPQHFWPPPLFGASPLDLPQFDRELSPSACFREHES